MGQKEMTFEELAKFNLGENYGDYLRSLRDRFKEALEKRARDKIENFPGLEVKFESLGNHFILEENRFCGDDCSEREEFYFSLQNNKKSVRLGISPGHTLDGPSLDFMRGVYWLNYIEEFGIHKLFSEEILDASILWITKGVMEPSFEKNMRQEN